MIRLTGEEIKARRKELKGCGLDPVEYIGVFNKAQLKKVVEWFLDNSYETTDECDLSGDIIRAIKVKDLQALLEEVK